MSGIFYVRPFDTPPGTVAVDAANMGLSTDLATSQIAQLGQTVGRAGDPAILTEDREIPDPAAHRLFLGRNNGVDNVIGFSPDLGISVSNNTGQGYQTFWQIGINSTSWSISSSSGLDILMQFAGGVGEILWTGNDGSQLANRFIFENPLIADEGFGGGVTKLFSAITPAYNVLATDFLILGDTTGGLLNLNLNPANLEKQFLNIKKVSADFNHIQLSPTAGTIQEIGAPVLFFQFNTQGESLTVYCDGTNFFII